jgi:hypothetical protein
MDEPRRAKLRIERVDAICTKSSTDTEEPTLDTPNTEKWEPNRIKLLIEREAPKCKKSITDKEAPNRMKLRRDIDEPRVA